MKPKNDPNLKIVFAAAGMVFDGKTPENEPLGGSESALVYLARVLAAQGVDVTVFNFCPSPGDFDGVKYRRWEELFMLSHDQDVDFFVCIRDPKIATAWHGSGAKILWCQDWYDQPVLSGLVPGMVDHIFFVGGWQKDGFCTKMSWPHEKAWVVPNGIVPEFYNSTDHFFRNKRMFYSSTPFRGLKHLINIYPKIRERVKGAELHIYGGMGVYQDWNSEYDRVYDEFEDMDGVVIHGPMGQRELAKEMEKCRLLAYPNTFPETCCTTALEAMAAGNMVVTSYRAGLVETAGYNGILIPGEPGTPEYDSNFVEECVYLLENDTAWATYARKAWAYTHNNCKWEDRVAIWLNNLDLIKERG